MRPIHRCRQKQMTPQREMGWYKSEWLDFVQVTHVTGLRLLSWKPFFKELDSVHRVCSSRSFREIHHFKNMQLFFTCNQNTWEKLKSLKKLQGIKVTPDIAQVNVVACEFHVMCIKMSLQCCQSRTDTDRVKGSRASNVRRHGWKSKNELQCLLF